MPRRRRFATEPDDDEALDAPRRLRRPRRRRRLLLILLSAAALVVAAPTIVAKTALRNVVLSRALPPGAGQIVCQSASFSWLGGQTLGGVTLVDGHGAPLLGAGSIALSQSLVGLAGDPDDLGKVTVTRPVVQLDVRDGGSNLEDLVRKLAEAAAQRADGAGAPGGRRPQAIEIAIVEGTVYGRDLTSGQQWRIDALEGMARRVAESDAWDITAAGVMTLAAAGQAAAVPVAAVAGDGAAGSLAAKPAAGAAGRFKLHVHPAGAGGGDAAARLDGAAAAPLAANDGVERRQLEVVADRVPLAPLEPWLARVVPAARLTGEASADLQVAWRPAADIAASGEVGSPAGEGAALSAAHLSVAGKLDAANLRFTSAALAGDLLELPTAAIALDAALADGQLSARQFTARSPWLQADMAGEFNLAELRSLTLKSLPTSDASITARAELAQLTRMLPRTLRLRPGVRVDAGSLEVSARSSTADGARRWAVAAAVQGLVGNDGVRPIQWTKPVEVGVDAVDSPDGPQFQRGLLRSSFATANVDGTGGAFEGELQFNLDELAAQLGQFVDLSAWKLQGGGQGQFSFRDAGDGRFAASADLDLKQINVERGGRVVWRDPQLRVEAQAAGSLAGLRPQRFDSGTVTMRGPGDLLSVELLEPVDLGDFNRSWLVKLAGNGPLELWSGRLRPWANLPEQLAGQTTLAAQLRVREGLLQAAQSQLTIENFQAQIGDRTISEPRIEAAGDFRWDRQARALESQNLEMTSSTLAGRARGVSIQLAASGPPTIRGEVALRGDLERIAQWQDFVRDRGGPPGLRPRGQAVGRLQLASDAQQATVQLTIKSEPFQLVNVVDGSLAWNEPQLELATSAAYSHADDRLQLASAKLTGKTVQLAGSGVVEQLRTAGVVRGDVNVTYDAAELATLLTAYLGPGVQIQGANAARLQASGRLFDGANPLAPADGGSGWSGPAEIGGTAAPPLTPPLAGAGDFVWNASAASAPAGAQAPAADTLAPASGLQLPASSLPPHWSRRWQVAVDTGWSAASLYGLPIGAAQLTANLRDGQVQVTPLDLAVGPGGRVNLHPRVLLDPAPQRLQLAPGPAISSVAISADVSQRMLRYAAPILAGATRAEGSFSFFLNSADVPLRQPKQGRLDGRLTIHQLAVMPGPMIQEVVNLVRQVEAVGKTSSQGLGAGLGQGILGLNILGGAAEPPKPIPGITMSERAIDVQVADGRVYHRNLEFLIDDVPVRSQGSVGFDETLELLIEVPIQEKWVGNRPALRGLIGQPLQIPVRGTFDRPEVDPRTIGAFAAQAAQQAAGGVLGEELNRALDKLLPR